MEAYIELDGKRIGASWFVAIERRLSDLEARLLRHVADSRPTVSEGQRGADVLIGSELCDASPDSLNEEGKVSE